MSKYYVTYEIEVNTVAELKIVLSEIESEIGVYPKIVISESGEEIE